MVAKWELGTKAVSSYYRVLLCILFEMSAEALGFLAPEEETCAWRPPATEASGTELEVHRRSFVTLASAASVAAAAASPAARVSPSPDPPSPAADPRDDLSGITARLRRLDGLLGPGHVLDQATAHQRLVVGLLREASGATARQRLAFEAADITGLVAWMSFDVQEFNASFAHYRAAATLADQANAPGILAWVLGSEALVLIHIGEDRQAVDVLSAADDVATRAGQSTARAWLAAIACHTHARLGDGDAAWRSYGAAETFSATPSEETHGWLSFFHSAHVVSAAGRAHLGLGQARNASRALEKALAQHPPRLVRERGQFLGHLAEARLACGELESGCGLLGDAFDIATRTHSTRIAGRIRDLRGAIPVRYQTAAVVRDLDERLHATK